jgi:hypothetical protein
MEQPDAGDIIPGSGGCRKLRWAAKGHGKRGGARVIYYWIQSVILIGLGQLDASETKTAHHMKLLYVGMTRAKERLMITASGRNEFTERLENMPGPVCAVA